VALRLRLELLKQLTLASGLLAGWPL
jgi:hypothetical protein